MNREELWDEWADPSGWCKYMERGTPLSETKKDFFKDLDAYFVERQQKELEKTKDKLFEHIGRLQKKEEEAKMAEEKAWHMDPKDMQEQVQKQLKNLKSIKL